MSELLDERVVEMRFDNADFERNVGQSIKTINRLKESLDFEDAGSSFDSLAESASKVDFTPIEKSIDEISVKFNMLEIVAAHVLGNIVSKAVDAGAKLAKSVSVDQISAGWSKYEQKTSSVQTIIAATGESIDTVNKKLEKLIWFADETSYDFVDMVNNIGKFTSAGVDLDVAVNSMMGISNWAALSGAGIQQASRAMYNLSQSIGMGYVAVQDWKSIELANMATQEFKETAIAMALELGTLKEINGEITTLDGKVEVTSETMRESLKKKWFTSDVLNETLGVYSNIANKVKEFQELHPGFETVSRALDEMAKTGFINLEDPIEALGYRAFVAAQEAKTLTEAINATKDAVSSGWMRTFELIFGNYDQAKKLWTNLANDMYDIFAAPGEARNEKLADVMKSNYQKLIDEMPDPDEFNNTLYNKLLEYTKENRGETLAAEIFSKYDSLEDLLKNEAVFGSELKMAFKGIADDNTNEIKRLESLSKNLKEKQISLRQAAIRLATDQYGAEEEKARKEVEKIGFDYDELAQYAQAWQNGIEIDWDAEQKAFEKNLDARVTALHDFNKQIKQVLPLKDFFNELIELGGRDKLIGGLENLMSFFKNFYLLLLEIGNGFSSLFGGGSFLSKAIDGFYKLSEVLGTAGDAFKMLQGVTYGLFHEYLPNFWDRFLHGYDVQQINSEVSETGEILDNVSKSVEHIPGLVDRLSTMYEEHLAQLPEDVQKTITNITGKVSGFFNSIPQKYEELQTKLLGEEQEITLINLNDNTVETKTERIGGLINELRGKIESFGDGIIPKTLNGISKFLNKIIDFFFTANEQGEESKSRIQWIFDKVSAFINLLKTIGKSVKDIFGTVFEDVKTFFAGGKYSFSEATIWALPDRLKKHFEDFKNSKAFQDVKAFFFGKDINTTTFGQSFHIAGLFDKVGNAINNFAPALDKIKSIFLGDYFEDGFGSFKTFLLGSEEEMSYFQYQLERLNGTDWFKKTKDFLFGVKDNKAPNGALNSFLTFFHTAEEYEKANIFGKIKLALQDLQVYLFGWKDANSTREFEGKLTPIIEKIKLLGALMNDFRKKIGLSWVKVTGEDGSEYWERQVGYIDTIWAKIKLIAAGVVDFGKKIAGAANEFRKWLGLDWKLVTTADGTTTLERIPGFIDKIKKAFDKVTSSKPFNDIKDFLFGKKKIVGYDLDVFGNEIPIIERADGALEKIKNTIEKIFKLVTSGNLFNNIKNGLTDFILGPIDKEGKRTENIFKRLPKYIKTAKESITDFLLGQEKLVEVPGSATGFEFVREGGLFNTIKDKIAELRSEYPWFESFCSFIETQIQKIGKIFEDTNGSITKVLENLNKYLFGYDVPKDGLGGLLGQTDHVKGIIDEVKDIFNSLFSGTKKKQPTIFDRISEVLSGAFNLKGLFHGPNLMSILKGTLASITGINVIFAGWTLRAASRLQFKSPLDDLIDTLKSFAESVAILAATLIGLTVFVNLVKKNGGEGGLVGGVVLLIGLISALIAAIKILSTKDNDPEISAKTILAIRVLASALTEISILMGVLTLLVKYTDSAEQFYGIAAVFAILAVVMGVAGRLMTRTAKSGEQIKTAAGSFFGIAAILFGLSNLIGTLALAFAGIYLLTKDKKWEDIAMPVRLMIGGIVAVCAMLLVATSAIKKLSGLKLGGEAIASILLLTVFVGAVGVLAVVLSAISDWKEIAAIFGGLSVLLLSLSESIKILSSIPKVNVGAVATLLGVVAVLGALAIGLLWFANVAGVEADYKKAFSLMVSIIEMAVAFGAVALVIGAIGNFSKILKDFDLGATLLFLGKVLLVVAAIVAVVIGVAGLIAKIEGAKEYIEGAGDILEAISKALGKIIGGFIGGIGEGITDSLPNIATNLSNFVDKLGPFLDGIKSVKKDHVTGMGYLVELMLGIASIEIINAFNRLIEWASGGNNLASAFGSLNTAAEGLKTFAGKVKDLNYKDVRHAANIIPALLNIATDERYRTGGISGLIKWITDGSIDLGKLFEKLNDGAAEGLKTFESKVKGLTYEDVEAAADVIPALLNIATDERYRSGGISGLVKYITDGDIDLGALFTKLNAGAADGLKTFEGKVKGLSYDDVKAAADVIPALLNIANDDRYRTGGKFDALATFLSGNIDLGALFTRLNDGAADGLKTFEGKVKGLKYDDVKAAADVIPALLNIASNPNYKTGGEWTAITEFLSGSVDLGELFSRLNDGAADGLITFAGKVSGFKYEDAAAAAEVIPALLNIASNPNYKTGGVKGAIESFIEGKTDFKSLFDKLNDEVVPGFVDFTEGLKDVTLDKVERATAILPKIFDMLSDDHYRSGGIGGWIHNLIEGETDFQGMFNALLGADGKPGIIDGLGKLSEKLQSKKFADLDYTAVTNAVNAMKDVFELMSFNTSDLITDELQENRSWDDYTFFNDADKLYNALGVLRTKVVPEIQQLQKDLLEAGVEADYISSIISSYSGLIQSLLDLSRFEGMIGAPEIGNFIIEGLINALRDGETRVQDAARGVAEAVKNGLTLTLQIQSPSKIAYQIGQFVAQGLYNGLRAGLPMNEKMASILGAETVKSLNNGMSKHTINMVKEDLLDENLFNMPDFSFINDLGMEDIDFDKMRSFLQEKFGEVLDPNMIDGFVGQFKMEWNKIPKVINNTDYAKLMTDIAKGEYGLGENEILENLTEHFSDEADAAGMAAKAINDYNKVLDGSLTINKDLLKQQKQNPPMTYEQYMEMIEHEQEGIKLANEGFFDKMAAANGTSREEEMKNWGYDLKITQNALDQMTMNSKEVYDTWEKMVADKELAEEESKLLQEWEQYVLGIGETTADTTKKISHYDSLEAKSLNTLLQKISEEKGVLTDADIELMKHLQQATVTEGMFGTDENGQRKELLKNFGIAEEYIDLAHDIGSAANVDEFIDQNVKIKRASDQSTEALEKQSEAAEKAEKAYSNLNPEMKSVWDNVEKAADEALKNGADSIHLDTSIFSGLDENVQKELSEALGTDGFDISFGKLGLQVVDDKGKTVNIKNGKDFQKYFGDKIDAKKLTSMIFDSSGLTSVFGNLGNLDELNMDWLEFGKTFFKGFTGKDSKHALSMISSLVSSLFSIEKSTDTINNSELEMHADTSEVSAADAYVQSLLDKYKLSESEILKVKQGYSNLVTDGTITKQQQEALEKFFNGVVIGTYGSIDKAREYMTETFGIDWDKFLTYHGQGLDTFTSSAMEYSKTVKDLINDENKYTTTNLMHDIEAGKWGEGFDRKKAFEAANIDYKKAMELYALWQKQGDEALKGYAANYGILTDEEAAAAKQQEAFNEALATTPEGAFKSIGDFLKGVNQVLEDSSTASNFTNFINDIVEPLKTVNLENAPAFEQVSNFIKMVRSVSNGKTGTEADFGAYIQSIADSINSVEINTEQFKPIADFLTGLNKLGETASETVAPFTKFISSVIELPEGDISVKATEASMVIVTRIIEVFEEHYDRFTEIGQSIVMRICAGIISMRSYAAETAATLSTTFLSTFQEQAVNKATELGKDFTSGLIEGLGSEETKTALKDAIGMLFGMPAEGAEGMAGAEAGMMTSLGKTFGQSFGTDFISGFGETVSGQTEALQTQLAPIITGLTSATEAFTSIEDPGAAITNFVDGIGQASEESLDSEALASIQTMAETIKGIISSSVPDGYGMGFAFVEGLYLGLMDGYAQYGPAIASMTSSMGASAVSSLGDGMEAHSPSRATMRLGGYFVEGFAIGIQNGARDAYKAGYATGKSAEEGTRDALEMHSPGRVPMRIGAQFPVDIANGAEKNKSVLSDAGEDLANELVESTSIMFQKADPFANNFMNSYGVGVGNFVDELNKPLIEAAKSAEKTKEVVSDSLTEMSTSVTDALFAPISRAPVFNQFQQLPHELMTPLEQEAAKVSDRIDDLDDEAKKVVNDILSINDIDAVGPEEDAYIAAGNALRKYGKVTGEQAKLLQEVWNGVMNGDYGVLDNQNKSLDRNARLLKKIGMTWDEFSLYDPAHNGNFDLSNALNGISQPVQELKESISSVKDLVNEIWKGSFGIGHAARKAAAEKLGYSYDVVKEYVSAVQGDASSIDWTKAEERAKTGGKNITQGLADGIKSKMGAAKEAATAASAKVSETVKSFFKMNSPSKLFIEFGGFLDEGLAIGISENTNLVTDNIENLSDVITSTFNDSVIGLSDMIESDLNTEPVIRPVIDMSEVTESASRIDSMLSHEQAVAISTTQNAEKLQNGEPDTSLGAVYNFTQNNYSPKALSRLEIYRQTRNQFAMLKGGNAS